MQQAKHMISIPQNLNGSRQRLEARIPEIVEFLALESAGTINGNGWVEHSARILRPLSWEKEKSYRQAMNEVYTNVLGIYEFLASKGVETENMKQLLFRFCKLLQLMQHRLQQLETG